MKSLTRTLTALFLIASLTSPAFAATHVIAELGNAPLLGQLDSTASLQANIISEDSCRFSALWHSASLPAGATATLPAQ
ncbi:MAG: hypothetical protein ACXWNH_06315 [Vulcanimicrobiaceae bacterium]